MYRKRDEGKRERRYICIIHNGYLETIARRFEAQAQEILISFIAPGMRVAHSCVHTALLARARRHLPHSLSLLRQSSQAAHYYPPPPPTLSTHTHTHTYGTTRRILSPLTSSLGRFRLCSVRLVAWKSLPFAPDSSPPVSLSVHPSRAFKFLYATANFSGEGRQAARVDASDHNQSLSDWSVQMAINFSET